jgi:hypothetical protein
VKKNKPSVQLLKERAEREFEDAKKELSNMSVDDILFFADDYAALDDVYFRICEGSYINEQDASFLLTLDYPLDMLSAGWLTHTKAYGVYNFSGFLREFIDEGGIHYASSIEIAYELSEKYGKDIPLNTACLLELVEMGRKIFRITERHNDKLPHISNTFDLDDEIFEFDTDESDDGEGID